MDDARELWQKQEVEEMRLSVEELRSKAAKFQSRIRRRNVREYVAALIVIALFGWFFGRRRAPLSGSEMRWWSQGRSTTWST